MKNSELTFFASDSIRSRPTLPATVTPAEEIAELPKLGSCGTTFVHDRIVGGQPARLHGWPWIAALGFKVVLLKV